MKTKISISIMILSVLVLSNLALADTPVASDNSTSTTFPVVYLSTRNYGFQTTWDDVLDAKGYNVSFIEHNFLGTLTNYSTSNSGNVSYYNISSMAAGTYQFRFIANDSADVWASTDTWTITVSKAVLLGSISSPDVTYPTAITATGTETNAVDNNVTYQICCGAICKEGKGPSTFDTAVSTVTCVFNTTGTLATNFTLNSSIANDSVTVSKGTPVLTTSVTTPIDTHTSVDYAGSESNTGDGSCTYTLELNGAAHSTGSSVADTGTRGAGTYNFTYYTTGCANYTSATSARTLVIAEGGGGTGGGGSNNDNIITETPIVTTPQTTPPPATTDDGNVITNILDGVGTIIIGIIDVVKNIFYGIVGLFGGKT